MEPYRPVLTCRNLIIFKVKELVGWYVIRQNIIAMRLQHSWEDKTVEHDIVLSNEVNNTCLWVLPPLLPVAEVLWILFAKLLSV